MFHHQRILVFIDQHSQPEALLAKASRIAKRCQGQLILFSQVFSSSLSEHEQKTQNHQGKDNLLRQHQLFLEEMASHLTEQGLSVLVQVIWHKQPLAALQEVSLRYPFDLVIKTTEYQNLLQRAFFSHTDWELIKALQTPVLLCKGEAWPERLSCLVCVDPSHDIGSVGETKDDRLIKIGLASNQIGQGELHLLHVFDPAPVLLHSEQPSFNHGTMLEELQQAHNQQLTSLAQRHGIAPEHTHLELGNVNTVIPEYVYTHAYGLVIMGAHCRHGLERFILGHTAERVLDRMTSDVLIVPK